MKRFVAATLLVAAMLPLAASVSVAGASSATSVTTSSKGWVVTLTIAKSSLRAGSSMPATLTIVNRTGRVVKMGGCQVDANFVIGIANAKVQYEPISGAVGCWTDFHTGTNVFHEFIAASYNWCGGQGGPKWGKNPTVAPKLPTGHFHTVVEWFGTPSSMPKPGILSVSVAK
jgi:hypothetical protein